MRIAPLAIALALTALPLASQAKDKVSLTGDEQVLLKEVQGNRRAVYEDNMGLTDAESAKFWPIYDRYEAERQKLEKRFIAMINEFVAKYDTLTDEQAQKLLAERMDIDRQLLELKEKYTKEMASALPGKKALRFAQIESRIANLERRNLYTVMPLAR